MKMEFSTENKAFIHGHVEISIQEILKMACGTKVGKLHFQMEIVVQGNLIRV